MGSPLKKLINNNIHICIFKKNTLSCLIGINNFTNIKIQFIVLVYGGLRGAVGIAFAMIANSDPELTDQLRDIVNF